MRLSPIVGCFDGVLNGISSSRLPHSRRYAVSPRPDRAPVPAPPTPAARPQPCAGRSPPGACARRSRAPARSPRRERT
ncbi:MAG TPA: hypothetical protein DCP91_02700 [Eggerthellaceae bacterium]|nr:hypothetical protein [Eggerthellaceae bacterium]